MLPSRTQLCSSTTVSVSRRRRELSARNRIVPVDVVVRMMSPSESTVSVLIDSQLPSFCLSIVPYISENFPIARRFVRVPHTGFPSDHHPIHTSVGLQSAFSVVRYWSALAPLSDAVSGAVPSSLKSERIYPSVPGVCGLDGNPGLSGVMIELAQRAPTRTMSARGMRVSFFIIFTKYIYILCILRFPATCRVFFF